MRDESELREAGAATSDAHFPIRLLTFALALTILAFIWFGLVIVDSRSDTLRAWDRSTRIERLRGVTLHHGKCWLDPSAWQR